MSSDAYGPVYFGTADYVLLGLMLAVSMVIGLYFAFCGNKGQSQEEYLLGGRSMSALPVCMSLFATFTSAISLLGIPTEVYAYGTMQLFGILGTILSYLLSIVSVVPLMYPLQLTSVNEYLALRYECKAVQTVGASIGIISSLSYMTMALLTPALALETAVGIPLWMSIILVGAVGTIYTTFGGIKSVIWTDVFQTFIIFGGTMIILIKGCIDAGGWSQVWQVSSDTGRIIMDDLSLDPRSRHTVWSLTFGAGLYWLSAHFSQSSVQRVVSTKSLSEANKVYIYTIPILIVFSLLLTFNGLVLVAYFYKTECDPLAAGYIKNKNQMVPYFVMNTLRFIPGLSGLYISTVFSGALSTISSGINSLAANTVEDFISKLLPTRSESVITAVTKVVACLYGTAAIGLAYLVKEFQGPVTQMTYTAMGATTGPLLGLFIMSAAFPQANYIGALLGIAISLVCSFWLAIGSFRYGHPTPPLPMGPTDKCWADSGNNTWTTPATSVFTYMSNGSALHDNSMAIELSTSVPNSQTQGPRQMLPTDYDFSIFDLSYIWYPVIGTFITIILGLVFSFIANYFMSRKLRPEAKYLFPFCRRYWYASMDVLDTEMKPRPVLEDKDSI